MTLLFISFIAGVLTVLAPCVLPLLPVIIGGSVADTHSRLKPYVIIASLSFSVVIFTLLLKASAAFITVPDIVWKGISGGILIIFGFTMLFPALWEKLAAKLSFGSESNKLLATGMQKKSFTGDILIGAALGPVFTSCSPTYFVILATVLPESFGRGVIFLFAYTLGLALVLLLISLLGRRFVGKLEGASNPHGWFKRTLGALFLLVGIAVLTGADKGIEAWLLNKGIYDGIGGFEDRLLEQVEE